MMAGKKQRLGRYLQRSIVMMGHYLSTYENSGVTIHSSGEFCVQAAFTLLDNLWQWVDDIKQAAALSLTGVLTVEEDLTAPIKVDVNLTDVEDDGIDYKEGFWIRKPSRSKALAELPVEVRNTLKENRAYKYKSLDEAVQKILGEERTIFILETVGSNAPPFYLCDSAGFLELNWETEGPTGFVEVRKTASRRLKHVLGRIRNQFSHSICYACVLCDLISDIRVLHGLDADYVALSPMFVCKNIRRETFEGNLALCRNPEDHACFGSSMRKALEFAKTVGVRREREGGEKLDCQSKEKYRGDEELIRIKDYYYYPTLEDAMERVGERYPVAATLSLYAGWGKKRGPGDIYKGPENGQSIKIYTKHAVIVYDFRFVCGVKCAICKLSNGEEVGYNGYLAVSLEVMSVVVGGAKKKRSFNWCSRKPSYLLDTFFSADVDEGSKPLIDVDKARANSAEFKVEPDSDAPVAPKYPSPVYQSPAASQVPFFKCYAKWLNLDRRFEPE